jgi:hypothetical protein
VTAPQYWPHRRRGARQHKNRDYYYLCPELRRKRDRSHAHTRERRSGLRPGSPFGRGIHLCPGGIKVLTEFYDPVALGVGESIYIDSNMGHAYVTDEGCEEATVLGVCSSPDESLMESLMSLHGDIIPTPSLKLPDRPRPTGKLTKLRRK